MAVLAAAAVALAGALNARSDARQGTGSGPGTAAVRPVGYTITVNLDGSVTFTANDLVDAAAATQALNAAGISGRVINASEPGTCTSGPNHDGSVDPNQLAGHAKGPLLMPEDSTTIRSSDYPPGGGVLIVVHAIRKQQSEIAFLIRLAYNDADDIPSCVDLSH